MDVIVTDDGVAFVQTPDGRLIEVGAVQKPAEGETPVAVTAADLRKKSHGILNPELLSDQKADPFEGVDPADADRGRGVRDDITAGGNTMTSLLGGGGKRETATGAETELEYAGDTSFLDPKYMKDAVQDIRKDAGLAKKKTGSFENVKKKLEELGKEG